MGLFDFMKKSPAVYVSESAFETNLSNQIAMSPEVLAQLRKLGVKEDTMLKLEVFFYTNSPTKAAGLDAYLTGQGYALENRAVPDEKSTFVVTGWSNPVQMSEATLIEWTEEMCRIGKDHDCEFDGWGTTPDQ